MQTTNGDTRLTEVIRVSKSTAEHDQTQRLTSSKSQPRSSTRVEFPATILKTGAETGLTCLCGDECRQQMREAEGHYDDDKLGEAKAMTSASPVTTSNVHYVTVHSVTII